jgi:hypothetical protein
MLVTIFFECYALRYFVSTSLQTKRDTVSSSVSILFGKRRAGTDSRPGTPASSPIRKDIGAGTMNNNRNEVVAVMFDRSVFDEKQAFDWWDSNSARVFQEVNGIL